MANEIRPDYQAGTVTRSKLDSWDFIQRADDEYRSRGGTKAKSIGGVARAIRSLVAS
jgi:hypothetical protein